MTVSLNSYSKQLDNLKSNIPDLEIILQGIGNVELRTSYDLSGEENITKIENQDNVYNYSIPYQMCKFALFSLKTPFKYSYGDTIYDLADHNYVDLPENNLRIIEGNRRLGSFNTTNQSVYIVGNYIYRPIDASLPCIVPDYLSKCYASSINFLYESFNRVNLSLFGIIGPEYICSNTTIYSLSDEYVSNKLYDSIRDFINESYDIAFLSINTRYQYYNDVLNLLKDLFNVMTISIDYIKNLINIHNNFKIIKDCSDNNQEVIPIIGGIRVANLSDGRSSIKALYDNSSKLTTTSYLDLEQDNVVVLKVDLKVGIIFSLLPLLAKNIIITTPSKYNSVVEQCKEKYVTVYTEEYFQEDLSRVDPFIQEHKQLLLSAVRNYFNFTYHHTRYLSQNTNNFFYPCIQYNPLTSPICRNYFYSWNLTSKGYAQLASYLMQKYNLDYSLIIDQET